MGGGLMQLVAYGAQDIYLTGNPQITFFKVVYRRHTNFAMESIEQTFNGTADYGKKVTCTVSRNGDLVSRVYLEVDLGAYSGGTPGANVGHRLIKNVEVEVGGQRVDKQYGEWLEVWADLTLSGAQKAGYTTMCGAATQAAKRIYVPLQFWFCRNPGLALPLIALQYHEVKINMEFNAISSVSSSTTECTGGTFNSASLWVDYVYLDTDERRRFAQVSHEYLIEQLQYTGAETLSSTSNKVRLNFNHPVKELVWVTRIQDAGDVFDWVDASSVNPTASAKLQLNGHDRFAERKGTYFNQVQPYQHHTRIPSSLGVNVYSFALKPEEHQPSGTCNFSRIDNATLNLTQTSSTASDLHVFAVNYNVLRVMSGMGGLAYSN